MNDCAFRCGLRHEQGLSLNLLGVVFTILNVVLDFPQKADSGGKRKVLVLIIYLELAVSSQFFLPLVK